jgi:hypothetical protein
VVTAFGDLYELPVDMVSEFRRLSEWYWEDEGDVWRGVRDVYSCRLEKGTVVAGDSRGKNETYRLVRELAAGFRQKNGSICCGELLGIKKSEDSSYISETRTAAYYAKRPCVKMVEDAATLFADYLMTKECN